MRRNFLLPLIVMVVLLLSIPALASARMVHNFDCANCHKPGAGLKSLANVCVDCHSTAMVGTAFPMRRGGNTNPIPNKTFAIGDASDALGSVTAAGEIPGDQTSHNWAAKDANPAAGATAPSNQLFYGEDNYSGNYVTCGRCHDPHGFDTNPKLLKLGAGTESAMCNDCHVDWASDTALSEGGSAATNVHPMISNYAAIAAAKPNQYNDVATLNAAPGQIALTATGGIDCLSCHGVHWTDSAASTTDGAAQALNVGDGKILKADGPLVDGSNVCQTCHKYAEHGLNRSGGANAAGCLICHGAHIEDQGGLLNNYMLRKNITTYLPKTAASGTVTGLTANIISTPDQKQRLWDYCFTCHNSADAVSGHNAGWNCVDCHSHDNATGSWTAAGGCNTCHGYPPSEGVASDGAGGNAGYAVNPNNGVNYFTNSGHYKNETNTKHSVHAGGGANYAFPCATCHKNNGHMDDNFDDVFLAPMHALIDSGGQLSSTYTPASGTCAAVYCHSNGGPRGGVPTVNNPGVWENGAAINSCDACHGNDATDMVTRSNSPVHIAHLNKGYSCQVCHSDTADNATTLAAGAIGGSHVDGDADVAFNNASLGFALGATSYGTNGTCSVYCHSNSSVNVSPDWDLSASGACGTCHQYSVANVATGSGTALGDAHAVHLFAANGPKIATCTTCHTHNGATGAANTDHVNGSKDLVAGACVACHGTDGVSNTGDDRMPIWTTASSVDCETCHSGSNIAVIGGNTAPAKTNFASLGHGDSGLTAAPGCSGCHDATDVGHFDGDQLDKRLKVDPQADGGAEDYAVSTNGWCQDCHTENAHFNTNNTVTVGNESISGDTCIICHEPHGDGMGSNTDAMLIVGNDFTDRTVASSYFDDTNFDGVCQICHNSAEVSHYTNSGISDGHNAATACYSCHSHTSTPQAFQGGECYACHGDGVAEYWPQSVGTNDRTSNEFSDFNDNGRHQEHMTVLAAKLGYTLPGSDAEQKAMCAYCHTVSDGDHAALNNGFADVFVSGAQKYWDASNDADATWNTTNYNTCSNIDCHAGKETLDGSYGWYDATTANCIMCHADVTDGSTPSSTGGTHVAHTAAAAAYGVTINCASCHQAATAWGTAPATGHWNGSWDVTGTVTLTYDGSFATGTKGSCGINACHEDGKAAASVEQLGDGYTWGTAEASACGICHAESMATAAHDEHLANSTYVPACTSCHTAATAATHINNSVNLDATKVVYASGTGACSTNVCHANGDWRDSVPAPGCTSCHSGTYIGGDNTGTGGSNYLPQYNMHDVTPTISGANHKTVTGCNVCHSTLAALPTHIDGTWEADSANNASSQGRGVSNGGFFTSFVDGTPPTCAATCHSDSGNWARKWSATAGNNDGTECGNCHGDFASGFVSGISARHSTDAQLAANHGGASTPCMTCHTLGDGAGDYVWATQHRDGTIQLSNDLGWADHGATVGCANCHSSDDDADNSMSNGEHEMQDTFTGSGGLSRWGRAFQNGGGGSCTTCHNANGGDHGGLTESNAVHAAHLASGYVSGCNDCHPHTGPGTVGDGGKHADGTVDFGGTYMNVAISYAKGSDFGGTCATANGCHDSAAGEWKDGLDAAGNNACIDCHSATGKLLDQGGYPPTSNEHSAHLGNDAIFLPASDCNLCHGTDAVTGAHSGHKNNAASIDLAGSSIAYDGTNCTNSCHTSAANDWTSGTGSLGCADCHEHNFPNTIGTPIHASLSASAGPAGDKHAIHVAADADYLGAATCTTCHGHSGALGNYATSGHVNGVESFTAVITTSPAASGNDSCVNTCHTAASANEWTSGSLGCADCHSSGKSLDAGGESDLSASVGPDAGRHDEHMASSLAILSSGCTACHGHSGALGNHATSGHVDGNMDYDGTNLTAFASPDCTNACHDVVPASAGDWVDSAALDCIDCHSGSYVGPTPASGLHAPTNVQDHAIPADGVFNCTTFCHSEAGGVSNMHIDGTTQNPAQATYAWGIGINSYDRAVGCAASCHLDRGNWKRKWLASTGFVDLKPLASHSPDNPVCANCHGTFSTGWNGGVSRQHAGNELSVLAVNHSSGTNECYLCHAWGHATYTGGNAHYDNKLQVNNAAQVGYVDNGETVGCANCHTSSDGLGGHEFDDTRRNAVDTGDNDADTNAVDKWVRQEIAGPEGSCNTCHQSGGATHGGSNESLALHNTHNASPYIDTDGNFVAGTSSTFNNCDTCHGHNGVGGHVNGTVAFANRMTAPAGYTLAGDTFDGGCTNTCHTAEAGEWNVTTGLGAGSTDACTSCHGSASVAFFQDQLPGLSLTWSASPAGPTTAKHAEHLGSSYTINCTNCHGANAATGAHASHKDKVIDDVLTYVSGTQTCTNSCHIANTSTDWTAGGTLACDDCHGVANSGNTYYRSRISGSHSSHVDTGSAPTSYGDATNNSSGTTYDFGCGQCHPTTIADHIDGSSRELLAGVNYSGGATGTCGTNACHEDGKGGAAAFTPTWGTAFVGDSCNKCHGNAPGTGAHSAHAIGIHADDIDDSDGTTEGIYSGTSGNVASSGTSPSAHGDGTTSTVLSCQICHFETVTVWYNALNSACANCHTDSNNPAAGNESMVVADTAKHLNGAVNVVFPAIQFKSKAQVREDITSITELDNNWTRTNGYKAANSYDLAKTSLNADTYVDSTCTVSCHNGIDATWVVPTGDCSKCHTSLPQ